MTLLWQLGAALWERFKELKRSALSDEWRKSASILVLRLTGGVVLTVHGVSELLGDHHSIAAIALANLKIHPTTATSLAIVFLELVGSVCILIGLFTRWVALALAAEMLWAAHLIWSLGNSDWDFPAAVAALMFFLASLGGGPFSVDNFLQKRSRLS
jgi:putative oxidoreductase